MPRLSIPPHKHIQKDTERELLCEMVATSGESVHLLVVRYGQVAHTRLDIRRVSAFTRMPFRAWQKERARPSPKVRPHPQKTLV
ncbi:hypothetical protein KL86DES1_21340 [uncultured Desulfovibrio sp.]|uniref:Uncharacterized protein n=1 Tax=uncultured Desulfovibrio sp. TaxID=167968 RepID=A0A212L7Q4_9BACT|nr:hypothetical protein KL86DES1_21340 [uncultured Desulfovibrio sp.]VZH34239.1 conserved protein of unknown function [Desulfovibrio sp. 86]